jgi:hypothetical protein
MDALVPFVREPSGARALGHASKNSDQTNVAKQGDSNAKHLVVLIAAASGFRKH